MNNTKKEKEPAGKHHSGTSQLQTAKARFSELFRRTRSEGHRS